MNRKEKIKYISKSGKDIEVGETWEHYLKRTNQIESKS